MVKFTRLSHWKAVAVKTWRCLRFPFAPSTKKVSVKGILSVSKIAEGTWAQGRAVVG